MKKLLTYVCIYIFVGVVSTAVLMGVFYALVVLLRTQLLALQIVALVFLLAFAAAVLAGAVLLPILVKKKKP